MITPAVKITASASLCQGVQLPRVSPHWLCTLPIQVHEYTKDLCASQCECRTLCDDPPQALRDPLKPDPSDCPKTQPHPASYCTVTGSRGSTVSPVSLPINRESPAVPEPAACLIEVGWCSAMQVKPKCTLTE